MRDFDWQELALGQVVSKLVDGSHNPPSKQVDGFPMLSARNIENGRIIADEFRYIDETSFRREHGRTRVAAGDVLITIVGTIGRTTVVPDGFSPFALQRSVAVLTTKPSLSPKFLSYQLQGPRAQRYFEENARGTAQRGVYLKTLSQTPIVVPSASVQEQIVAEIDKQFSRLDEAVANLQRVKANLKRYRASVLTSAVTGQLSATESNTALPGRGGHETGGQLLDRFLQERRSRWKGRFREPARCDVPKGASLPQGWTWTSLDSLAWDSGYGTSVKCSYEQAGVPILRIPNVQSGAIDLDDMKFAPDSFEVGTGNEVAEGDMLVIRTNGSKSLIGRAALVTAQPSRQLGFASYLIRFRLVNSSLLPAWLAVVWSEQKMRHWLESRAATSAGQHNISQSVLATAPIPLPPAEEQRRIVAEVDRRLSIVRELEAEVDANLKRAQALRQAVLAKAFSGAHA